MGPLKSEPFPQRANQVYRLTPLPRGQPTLSQVTTHRHEGRHLLRADTAGEHGSTKVDSLAARHEELARNGGRRKSRRVKGQMCERGAKNSAGQNGCLELLYGQWPNSHSFSAIPAS